DELKGTNAVMASGGYAEAFIQKDFCDYLAAMKERGLRVNINTNGLLMKDEHIQRFVELEIDGIFVSMDAITPETFKKVRGSEELEKIKELVHKLLDARGDKLIPRIGVSFVVEEENEHEREDFVDYWLQHVDTVRVAERFSNDIHSDLKADSENRRPCPMLYDTMSIHYNGDVPVCCWEGSGKTYLGNVFEDGIKGVWHGEKYQEVRHYHETGQFDKVPFCKGCNDWARYETPEEIMSGNIFIRKSPLLVYYNRIDRLSTWKFGQGESVKAE
ncbi:MAG: radical SAM protein, partial [Candidatus Omnitrophica bacterium]|nr:radical SAM protein [Candidatus Omnitrophota bacterium]